MKNFISEIMSYKAIAVPVISWFIAQFIKVVLHIIKENRLELERFFGSGGMPSSHSAFIVALTTVIGKNYGLKSGEFAISLAVSLIVMYDAAGVRRAAGKQAEVLNRLLFSHRDRVHTDIKLKELLGHSPIEVAAGAILGMTTGIFLG